MRCLVAEQQRAVGIHRRNLRDRERRMSEAENGDVTTVAKCCGGGRGAQVDAEAVAHVAGPSNP